MSLSEGNVTPLLLCFKDLCSFFNDLDITFKDVDIIVLSNSLSEYRIGIQNVNYKYYLLRGF